MLQSLFNWLDRDGNGRLDAEELAIAVDVAQPTAAKARGGAPRDLLTDITEALREGVCAQRHPVCGRAAAGRHSRY